MDSCQSRIAAGGATGAAESAFAAALQFFVASQCLVHEPWPEQARLDNGSNFDFIIVGGGTAGSTLAARLSEESSFTVLLVEAGGDPPLESIIPKYRDELLRSRYDWNFKSVQDQHYSKGLLNSTLTYPSGKVLGGSDSINGMLYSRGYAADYDGWASVVGDEWKYCNVLDYFKKTECLTDETILKNAKTIKYHGFDGELEVTGLKKLNFDTEMFLEAFGELGFNIISDRASPNPIGAGHISFTIHNGQRHSAATALLNKAAKRDNLIVLKNALVTKVLIENKEARGISVLLDDEHLQFFANREVIVSAGTFNTAKLLLLSGIGPKEHLQDLGIKVVQDLPVGDNLNDHIQVIKYLAAENGTCYTNDATSKFNIIQYLYDRTGSLSIPSRMGLDMSLSGSFTPDVADFAIFPQCVPMDSNYYKLCMGSYFNFKPEICSKLDKVNKNHELIIFAVSLFNPKSRGKVRLRSSDPLDEPLIYPGKFSNLEDLEGFLEPISIVDAVATTSYFRSKGAYVVDIEIDECKDLEGPEAVMCQTLHLSMSSIHQVGTAAMGSVLDAHLKVKGVRSLRVVDASVMPQVVKGNTKAPVVMIAEKAADFIKKECGVKNTGNDPSPRALDDDGGCNDDYCNVETNLNH